MDRTFNPEQFRHQLYRDTSRKHRYDGQTGAAFTDWQDGAREALRTVLGHHLIRDHQPSNERTPHRSETVTNDGYERQTWHLQTEREVSLPFYLLLPTTVDPPYPVMLTLHGHTDIGKELTVGAASSDEQSRAIREERRDTAVQAAQRGYAAIAPDMRAFGALADSNADGRACTELQKTAQLYGRSLLGDRVWDVLQLVDFVERRPPLDDDRIGITGHSGGAAVALFGAALDDRLAPIAPNAYFCALADSVVPIDHCVCNHVPGLLRFGELWDVAGLIAPRPLVIATGQRDQIIPVDGTRRAFENLREIYAAVDAQDRCELYVGPDGHRFYPDGVWPFVHSHL